MHPPHRLQRRPTPPDRRCCTSDPLSGWQASTNETQVASSKTRRNDTAIITCDALLHRDHNRQSHHSSVVSSLWTPESWTVGLSRSRGIWRITSREADLSPPTSQAAFVPELGWVPITGLRLTCRSGAKGGWKTPGRERANFIRLVLE